MQEGGDRGKGPNKTGTQPTKRGDSPLPTPGNRDVKGGPGRGGSASTKHAAERGAGAKTTETRKAGPKKTAARTTTRSGDK
jgi:hypothetical protein